MLWHRKYPPCVDVAVLDSTMAVYAMLDADTDIQKIKKIEKNEET